MAKWGSYGYGPGSDPHERQVEDELFSEYIPVILANLERIIETPEYFFCQLGSAWLSVPFVFGGGGLIPLGALALLWRAGKMVFDCPGCGGRLYAVGVSGSVLSGCGSIWGVCKGCRQNQVSRRQCGETILAVGEMLGSWRNEPVIEKGKQPRFDWAEGLVGESTPDRVIVPAVEAVDLWTLVRRLSGAPVSA